MSRRTKKNSPFGEIISVFMANRGLSTRALADIAGVSPGNIVDWRKGVNPTDYLAVARLADFFGVTVRFLLTGQEELQSSAPDGQWPQSLHPGETIFSGPCEIIVRRLVSP